MTVLRSLLPFLVALLLAIVMQLVVKPLVGPFYGKIMLDIATNVVLAVSLTMVNGFTGQFSMGHAAFMLVGAYVSAMMVYYGSMLAYGDAAMRGGMLSGVIKRDGALPVTGADLLFLGSLLTGGCFAALCGYLVGLPSLRLRGDYLAIVTLGFGEIMRRVVEVFTTDVLFTAEEVRAVPLASLPKYLGGPLGFIGLPFYTNLFWTFLFAGITIIVAYRLKLSTFGRAFLSIREDEIASEAMGVNTTKYKVWAFTLAAFFAGIAGGLYAHTSGVQLSPGELGFQKSFEFIIMVVLGGLGSISGAAIAAAILTVLPEWLRDPGHVWYYGLALVVLLLAATGGRRWKAALIIAGVTVALEIARAITKASGVDLSQYRMILYALTLILMMILRPKGLLGVREIWDKSLWREWLMLGEHADSARKGAGR